MKNEEFTHYYGPHSKRANYVRRIDVRHKSKKISFWCDGEQTKYIEDLAKELGCGISKIIKDMIDNEMLDKKLRDQKFEISDLDHSDLPKW